MSFLFSSGVRTAIPDSGVARYTFDDADTSTGNAIDVWNGNDAPLNGGVTTGASGANQTYSTNEGYSFDGTDDYVDLGVISSTFPSPVSAAGWFKLDSASTQEYIFVYDGGRWAIAHEYQASNGLEFTLYDGSAFQSITSGISDTNWHHVVGTYDGSTMEFYVDGVSQGTINTSFSADATFTDNVQVAARQQASEYGAGDGDDWRVYDKVLNSTEVSNLYNNESI